MPESELSLNSGLRGLDYATIVAYMVGTFGIAWWFGRKQKTTEDFFVGGRHMPWFAVGLSILATLFSTLTYLGMPGEVIKHGIGIYTGYLSIPVTAAVIMLLWIPFFMRLRLVSAYEYLERRFSYPMRLVGAGIFVLLRLGWMSMVVFAASMALNSVKGPDVPWLAGDDVYWIVGVIGLTAAVYTAVGGIQAMIWTDVLQCLLLLSGVLLAIFYVAFVDGTGPADWLATARGYRTGHTSPPLFSTDVTVRVTVVFVMLNNFFWTVCTHGSDQVVLQRYFSTSSLRAARKSYFINLIVDLTMGGLLAMAGLALLAFYLKHGQLWPTGANGAKQPPDRLFPHFLGTQLPVGCAGLVIAAFLCDAIQTLESGVNAITAVVTNDVVPRLRHGGRRMFSELGFARLMTVVVSLIVTSNAYYVIYLADKYQLTLIDMMPKFFNMFVGPLAALFFIGMFVPRATTRSAAPAVVVGLATTVLWSWWQQIFGTPYAPSIMLAIAVPCTTTLLTGFVLSLVVERGGPHPGRDYTWRNVIRNIPAEPPQPTATPPLP